MVLASGSSGGGGGSGGAVVLVAVDISGVSTVGANGGDGVETKSSLSEIPRLTSAYLHV